MMYLAFGISIILIILGFIALIFQKTYIDANTLQPTEIDIPIFGKMKSNYPSLVFVFLGVVVAFYTINICKLPVTHPWVIDGKLISNTENIDWRDGQLIVFPREISTSIEANGQFRIGLDIEVGKKFEDIIQRIDYSHPKASNFILPESELSKFDDNKPSLLKAQSSNSRTYKPLEVEIYPKQD